MARFTMLFIVFTLITIHYFNLYLFLTKTRIKQFLMETIRPFVLRRVGGNSLVPPDSEEYNE